MCHNASDAVWNVVAVHAGNGIAEISKRTVVDETLETSTELVQGCSGHLSGSGEWRPRNGPSSFSSGMLSQWIEIRRHQGKNTGHGEREHIDVAAGGAFESLLYIPDFCHAAVEMPLVDLC